MKENRPSPLIVRTTVGDLIAAISEAITETKCADEQVQLIRNAILKNLFAHAVRDSKKEFQLFG